MNTKFCNLLINFENDIINKKIKTLNDICNFIMDNGNSFTKANEIRRLFRNGCNLLNINLNQAKVFIKSNDSLILFLDLQSLISLDKIDEFLKYF